MQILNVQKRTFLEILNGSLCEKLLNRRLYSALVPLRRIFSDYEDILRHYPYKPLLNFAKWSAGGKDVTFEVLFLKLLRDNSHYLDNYPWHTKNLFPVR